MPAATDLPIRRDTAALLACPFRPFFLLAAGYAVLLIAAWSAYLFTGATLPVPVDPFRWHGHEMLYGMVPAAIAGFLLTAIANWTGTEPLRGTPLLVLIALWLSGRTVMFSAAHLPYPLVAAIDLAFLPVLAGVAGRIIVRHGNYRNLVLVVVLVALAAGNLAMHLDFAGLAPGLSIAGEVVAFDLVTVMMIVIGGRITPAFTANWLHRNGRNAAVVHRSTRLDAAAMTGALAMVPADLSGLPVLASIVAGFTALITGWRLARWGGWHARSEPLLWILHLGMAWIVLALLLKAAGPWTDLVDSAWMHTLGAGAMATLILGVMTRVAAGHTGRPLALLRGGLVIYLAVTVAAVARVAAALGLVDYRAGLLTASAGWLLSFGAFVVLYWPILTRPRADGRPG